MATGIKQSPIRRVIAINASNGAAVIIKSTCPARYVEIQECPPNAGTFNGGNFAPQGLNYQLPADGDVATFGLNPGAVWTLGDKDFPMQRAVGSMTWTDPSGQACGGTQYMQAISATATATQVEVREWL